MKKPVAQHLLAASLLLACQGCVGVSNESDEQKSKIATKGDTTSTYEYQTVTRSKTLSTVDEFEKSGLFQEFSWKLIRKWPGYRVYIDSTLAYVAVLQTSPNGTITAFRVCTSSENPDKDQKRNLIRFLTEFIHGDGASTDNSLTEQVGSSLLAHLSESNTNHFIMKDVDIGVLQTPLGGLRGFQCDTKRAKSWDIGLADNHKLFGEVKSAAGETLGRPWADSPQVLKTDEQTLQKESELANARKLARSVWEQQQKDNLYAFLFQNGQPPMAVEPPKEQAEPTGSHEIPQAIPATTRLQAIADARLSAGRPDPFSQITSDKTLPFPSNRSTSKTVGGHQVDFGPSDWLNLIDGRPTGQPKLHIPPPPNDLPVPDTPVSANSSSGLVPPPPPVTPSMTPGTTTASSDLIPASELPLPPEKPLVSKSLTPIGRIDDRVILAVNPQKAMENGWPRTIILGAGDQFETVRVLTVTNEAVTLDEDGDRVVLRL